MGTVVPARQRSDSGRPTRALRYPAESLSFPIVALGQSSAGASHLRSRIAPHLARCSRLRWSNTHFSNLEALVALTINNLSKTYPNGVKALKNLSFSIGNSMFGLVGPNGAGKSSLMRTIATLQDPDSGSIDLDGIDVLASEGRSPPRPRLPAAGVWCLSEDFRSRHAQAPRRHEGHDFLRRAQGDGRRPTSADQSCGRFEKRRSQPFPAA